MKPQELPNDVLKPQNQPMHHDVAHWQHTNRRDSKDIQPVKTGSPTFSQRAKAREL